MHLVIQYLGTVQFSGRQPDEHIDSGCRHVILGTKTPLILLGILVRFQYFLRKIILVKKVANSIYCIRSSENRISVVFSRVTCLEQPCCIQFAQSTFYVLNLLLKWIFNLVGFLIGHRSPACVHTSSFSIPVLVRYLQVAYLEMY